MFLSRNQRNKLIAESDAEEQLVQPLTLTRKQKLKEGKSFAQDLTELKDHYHHPNLTVKEADP